MQNRKVRSQMIPELYFDKAIRSSNLITGAPIKVNQNNGRYAFHRVVSVYVWYCGSKYHRATIVTVELNADWTDGKHHVWNDGELAERMELLRAEKYPYGYEIVEALWWEHDVVESFVEEYHVHLN